MCANIYYISESNHPSCLKKLSIFLIVKGLEVSQFNFTRIAKSHSVYNFTQTSTEKFYLFLNKNK